MKKKNKMTPEQFALFLEDNRRSTAQAIEITVNGKLEKIEKKLDIHIARVEPYIIGFEGSKTIGKVIMWVGGIIITIGGAFAVLKNLIK